MWKLNTIEIRTRDSNHWEIQIKYITSLSSMWKLNTNKIQTRDTNHYEIQTK